MNEPLKRIEIEPFKYFDTYKEFKKYFKKNLKSLSMKRDNDIDALLVAIWNFSNQRFLEGHKKGLEEKQYQETCRQENDFVGLIDPDEDHESLF